MDLEATVAAPFASAGKSTLGEGEFVVSLSLERDWFSPDQAKQLVDVATAEGLLERDGEALSLTVDPDAVTVPADETPDEDVLRRRSPFERVLAALVDDGAEKRDAVAGINKLQGELGVTADAAAVLYARRRGLAVDRAARAVRESLGGSADGDA
ncbi:MAG: DUF2240 family protein [Halobacteriaceae archaeon]